MTDAELDAIEARAKELEKELRERTIFGRYLRISRVLSRDTPTLVAEVKRRGEWMNSAVRRLREYEQMMSQEPCPRIEEKR